MKKIFAKIGIVLAFCLVGSGFLFFNVGKAQAACELWACNECLTETPCLNAFCYWNGDTCEEPLCDFGDCHECLTENDCTSHYCAWNGDTCDEPVCELGFCWMCLIGDDCTGAGCYWTSEVCEEPPVVLTAPSAPDSLLPVASTSLFAASVSYITTIFNDFLPYISIVVGVALAFWLVPKAIALVKRLLGGKKT